jgi:hypothetical protein
MSRSAFEGTYPPNTISRLPVATVLWAHRAEGAEPVTLGRSQAAKWGGMGADDGTAFGGASSKGTGGAKARLEGGAGDASRPGLDVRASISSTR